MSDENEVRIRVRVPDKYPYSDDNQKWTRKQVEEELKNTTSRTGAGINISKRAEKAGRDIHRGHILNEIDDYVHDSDSHSLDKDCDTII